MVAVTNRPREREQLKLRLKSEEILTRPVAPLTAWPELPSPFNPEPIPVPEPQAEPDDREPFGRWLIGQQKRDGWVGDLARSAKADPRFPKEGDVEAVRKWLSTQRASGDDYEALDDTEMDWLSV
jgi:hypothetical protein